MMHDDLLCRLSLFYHPQKLIAIIKTTLLYYQCCMLIHQLHRVAFQWTCKVQASLGSVAALHTLLPTSSISHPHRNYNDNVKSNLTVHDHKHDTHTWIYNYTREVRVNPSMPIYSLQETNHSHWPQEHVENGFYNNVMGQTVNPRLRIYHQSQLHFFTWYFFFSLPTSYTHHRCLPQSAQPVHSFTPGTTVFQSLLSLSTLLNSPPLPSTAYWTYLIFYTRQCCQVTLWWNG